MKTSALALVTCLIAFVSFGHGCSKSRTSEAEIANTATKSITPEAEIVAGEREVVFKEHNVKFAIPDGWKLKQNDGKKQGSLSILQQDTKEAFMPTICLWLGGYDEELANAFGVTRGEMKIRMAVSGVELKQRPYEYVMNVKDFIKEKQTTKHLH